MCANKSVVIIMRDSLLFVDGIESEVRTRALRRGTAPEAAALDRSAISTHIPQSSRAHGCHKDVNKKPCHNNHTMYTSVPEEPDLFTNNKV